MAENEGGDQGDIENKDTAKHFTYYTLQEQTDPAERDTQVTPSVPSKDLAQNPNDIANEETQKTPTVPNPLLDVPDLLKVDGIAELETARVEAIKPPRRRSVHNRSRRIFNRNLAKKGLQVLGVLALLETPGSSTHSSEYGVFKLPEGRPSKKEVLNGIEGVNNYMIGLLKAIDPTPGKERFSLSEYMGFPLVVLQEGRDAPLLVGRPSDSTSITDVINLAESESFVVHFLTNQNPLLPPKQSIGVSINWNHSPTSYAISLTNAHLEVESATILLREDKLETFNLNNIGQTFTHIFPNSDNTRLQSLRYTIRGGAEFGLAFALAMKNQYQVEGFLRELVDNGLKPNLDYHSPIWGLGDEYAAENYYNTSEMFRDCDSSDPVNNLSYAYISKVCKSPGTYIQLSTYDTLFPLVLSLHLLNRYANPTIKVNGLPSPLEVADDMIQKFILSKEGGIGAGAPGVGYDKDISSCIRTADFGALMTSLGYDPRFYKRYSYDRKKYMKYADRVAQIALHQQIKNDGIVTTTDGTYYRPNSPGGFYMQWNNNGLVPNLHLPSYYALINAALNVQTEYSGIIPSNAESAADMNAFLRRYFSLAYLIPNS